MPLMPPVTRYLEIKDNMRALHLLSGVEMAPAHRLSCSHKVPQQASTSKYRTA